MCCAHSTCTQSYVQSMICTSFSWLAPLTKITCVKYNKIFAHEIFAICGIRSNALRMCTWRNKQARGIEPRGVERALVFFVCSEWCGSWSTMARCKSESNKDSALMPSDILEASPKANRHSFVRHEAFACVKYMKQDDAFFHITQVMVFTLSSTSIVQH